MRTVCWPVLKYFEGGKVGPSYKPSFRTILDVVGTLFLLLASFSAIALIYTGEAGALIPLLVFLGVGGVSLIVGLLGSDAAVSRMWGNR